MIFFRLHAIVNSFHPVSEVTSRCAGTSSVLKFSACRHKISSVDFEWQANGAKPRLIVLRFFFSFSGLLQVFVGNTDENTIVYNELNGSIVARYTRFQPTAWHNHISMRVELYGCKGTFFGNILLLWNSVKNTNKSLFDLSLLAAFTTYCIAKYMLMFTFTVMAFRDRWRNLFNFLLNRFLPLKKPSILILWLRCDFIECLR